MDALRPLAFALLAALSLSGCADEPPAPVQSTADEPAPPPEPQHVVGQDSFGWTAAVGTPLSPFNVQLATSNAMTFDVPDGAESLTVQISWTCATPLCDLHAYLAPATTPSPTDVPAMIVGGSGEHAQGGSPLTLTIEAPTAGEWKASVHADAPQSQVSGTFLYDVLLSGASQATASA